MKEEKLIDLLPEYPCLFVVSSADFKNMDIKEVAYVEMAEKIETDVTYCTGKHEFLSTLVAQTILLPFSFVVFFGKEEEQQEVLVQPPPSFSRCLNYKE